jgi:hypothetical protein
MLMFPNKRIFMIHIDSFKVHITGLCNNHTVEELLVMISWVISTDEHL